MPALTLILADNQIAAARALETAGATPYLDVAAPGFEIAFAAKVQSLLSDTDRRAALSAASATICDGLGADRAAEIFLQRIAL